MRKLLTGVFCLIAAPALAGGMGDPSEHTKQMNAICEMQRRGEGPRYPDLCLPEFSPAPIESRDRR